MENIVENVTGKDKSPKKSKKNQVKFRLDLTFWSKDLKHSDLMNNSDIDGKTCGTYFLFNATLKVQKLGVGDSKKNLSIVMKTNYEKSIDDYIENRNKKNDLAIHFSGLIYFGAILNFMMNFVHSNLEVVKPKLFDEAISQAQM
ncbi:hypothetical protein BpHYR1_001154 [Brachionus plicatilis]|uniref:Uncharacterized protein n=1 Tax=Brachionus plicatilis TaxID=10195 RepID=A0A3M7RKC7_BRAPC|nr:hypothetical protein BpHYR1_001154 [Brachionus plicatilis]